MADAPQPDPHPFLTQLIQGFRARCFAALALGAGRGAAFALAGIVAAVMCAGSLAWAGEPVRKETVEVEYYPDRTVKAELRYAGGLLNGESRFFAPDGTLTQTCEYRTGRPHGALKKYGPDGVLLSETQVIGEEYHGPRRTFYPDGRVKDEAHFERNRLTGEARQYYPDGTLRLEERFEDDRIVGTKKPITRTDV